MKWFTRTKIFSLTIVAMWLYSFPVRPMVVSGDSMSPTYTNFQPYLITNKIGKLYKNEVICFKHGGETYIKRIAYLPGETVTFFNIPTVTKFARGENILWSGWSIGQLPFSEVKAKYPKSHILTHDYTVQPGEIYVIGDNPESSVDSRKYGPIQMSDVTGVLLNQKNNSATSTLYHIAATPWINPADKKS